jgi:hypothetical protein
MAQKTGVEAGMAGITASGAPTPSEGEVEKVESVARFRSPCTRTGRSKAASGIRQIAVISLPWHGKSDI